jgi:hypothetical protein
MAIKVSPPETSKRRTLLDIEDDFLALDDLLAEMGGEVTEEEVERAIDKWFAELGEERDRKIQGYLKVYRERELHLTALVAEQDRLAARIKTIRSAMDWMKRRLHQFMQNMGLPAIGEKDGIFKAKRCKNGGALPVILSDPKAVPEAYISKRIVESINTDAIREKLLTGEPLPFAHLGERGEHLRIS